MDLKELEYVNPQKHWYYQSKISGIRQQLDKFLSRKKFIIDIGAGSGFFGIELSDQKAEVLCVDPNYSIERDESNGRIKFRRAASSEDNSRADLFLFIDVLEHVEDDVALLKSYLDEASYGATVAITVPAFEALWSAHDVYLEHFRRYRLSEIKKVAEKASLEIIDCRYLFGSIFPIAYCIRKLKKGGAPSSDLANTSMIVNKCLTFLLKLENRLVKNRVAGLTALVVARKSENNS